MKKIKLGDVIDVRRGASLSGEHYSTSGVLKRLTLGNFNYPNGGFKENTSKDNIYFTGSVKKEFILKKGDIITPLTEQVKGLLGETARIPEDNIYIQSGDAGLLIPDEEKIDKSYLYYLLPSSVVRKQLSDAAQQTKIRHTSPDKIKDCICWIPESLSEQRKIGSFLDGINNIIKNNDIMIENAKRSIDTIYDKWFLQYDFPKDSQVNDFKYSDELKRDIPCDWNVLKLKDICEISLGGTPDTNNESYWNGGINWLNSGEISDFPITHSAMTISNDGLNNSATKVMPKGTVVLSITGNIRVSVTAIETCANQSVVGVAESKEIKNVYIYPFLSRLIDYYIKISSGNCQQHINKGTIEESYIPIPSVNLLNKYYEYCSPIFASILEIGSMNYKLKTLRDFFSPLLMNGQLRIKD